MLHHSFLGLPSRILNINQLMSSMFQWTALIFVHLIHSGLYLVDILAANFLYLFQHSLKHCLFSTYASYFLFTVS